MRILKAFLKHLYCNFKLNICSVRMRHVLSIYFSN